MKDYTHYKSGDFAKDDHFIQWVTSSENNPALDEFWRLYIKEHPTQKSEILEAKAFILAFLSEQQYIPDDYQQRKSLNKVLHKIRQPQAERRFSIVRKKQLAFLILSLIAMIAFIVWQQLKPIGTTKNYRLADYKVKENTTRELSMITLPDGSTITLHPFSKVSYNMETGDSLRQVYLEGEAFFDVIKNPRQPFVVHANGITTRVLGTSFNIRTFTNEDEIKVVVKTGRVSVVPDDPTNSNSEGVILTPNLQATYSRSTQKISKTIITDPKPIIAEAPASLQFHHTPVAEVFKKLETAYGIDILFDEQLVQHCHLNAAFEDEPLTEKLDLICEAIGAQYEIIDSQFIIHSEGCTEPN